MSKWDSWKDITFDNFASVKPVKREADCDKCTYGRFLGKVETWYYCHSKKAFEHYQKKEGGSIILTKREYDHHGNCSPNEDGYCQFFKVAPVGLVRFFRLWFYINDKDYLHEYGKMDSEISSLTDWKREIYDYL